MLFVGKSLIFLLCLTLVFPLSSTTCAAADNAVGAPLPASPFQCNRSYTHLGKSYACDSFIRQDGEGLRPLLKRVPESLEELNLYQENTVKIRYAAYTGTLGILIAATSLFLARKHSEGDHLDDTGTAIQRAGLIGGLGMTSLSLVYGLTKLRENEAHLIKAIFYYNAAHPQSPIELQFQTGMTF